MRAQATSLFLNYAVNHRDNLNAGNRRFVTPSASIKTRGSRRKPNAPFMRRASFGGNSLGMSHITHATLPNIQDDVTTSDGSNQQAIDINFQPENEIDVQNLDKSHQKESEPNGMSRLRKSPRPILDRTNSLPHFRHNLEILHSGEGGLCKIHYFSHVNYIKRTLEYVSEI